MPEKRLSDTPTKRRTASSHLNERQAVHERRLPTPGEKDRTSTARGATPAGDSGGKSAVPGSARSPVKGLPTSLTETPDRKLLSQIKKLARLERVSTLQILLHLIEIERRELHLGLGYRSMFDYCVRCLRYSASASTRRIQTARCLARHPEVYSMLQRNEVNLTTVALVSKALTDENKTDLLTRIANKTQRQVEELIARYGPPIAYRDRVRSVCVRVEKPQASSFNKSLESKHVSSYEQYGSTQVPHDRSGCKTQPEANSPGRDLSTSGPNPGGGEGGVSPGLGQTGLAGLAETGLEQRVQIQFLAKPSFINKYQEVRALLSHRLSHSSFAEVFEMVLESFIERYSPRKRVERRVAREERKRDIGTPEGAEGPGGDAEVSASDMVPPSASTGPTRHIPAAVRDAVFIRDEGKCTFVSPEGTRCGSTMGVELDHVVPVAKGGAGTLSNLRLLCAKHNRLEAERVLGIDMKRYRRRE